MHVFSFTTHVMLGSSSIIRVISGCLGKIFHLLLQSLSQSSRMCRSVRQNASSCNIFLISFSFVLLGSLSSSSISMMSLYLGKILSHHHHLQNLSQSSRMCRSVMQNTSSFNSVLIFGFG